MTEEQRLKFAATVFGEDSADEFKEWMDARIRKKVEDGELKRTETLAYRLESYDTESGEMPGQWWDVRRLVDGITIGAIYFRHNVAFESEREVSAVQLREIATFMDSISADTSAEAQGE